MSYSVHATCHWFFHEELSDLLNLVLAVTLWLIVQLA